MNPVEIEEQLAQLAGAAFVAEEFPFQFLEAFGNKATTIKRLRDGATNQSDVGGLLQRENIHLKVCAPGALDETLAALRTSPATRRHGAKIILATDGSHVEAEQVGGLGETLSCPYTQLADHFGFFLGLAGISMVGEIRESEVDIKAAGRLNRLYVALMNDNPDWGRANRRHDMNHFMARLIFCFFAEDTSIFHGENLFTTTIRQMSANNAQITHEVIGEIFRAMNTPLEDRRSAKLRPFANGFPYANGGLFSGDTACPRFSKVTRSHLIRIGELDWTRINPDIFGSMVQAVADVEERSKRGLHYTSVPNILKVLNPLFLDELRTELAAAGEDRDNLRALKARLSNIRVFDPACGSGNFLVIAYKRLRELEAEINARLGQAGAQTAIPLTNFRGIEISDFPAEIARLALIIAEFQCDKEYRGESEARAEFLPLDADNWIVRGNALCLDWLDICPPTGRKAQISSTDLLDRPKAQAEIGFKTQGGETYICGNPPYLGSNLQDAEQKEDLCRVFEGRTKKWKSLDYVSGWFMKAADFGTHTKSAAAFVSTNSICQGRQVETLWKPIFATGHKIFFAHRSFEWSNLASRNAGVLVVIVGIAKEPKSMRRLFFVDSAGQNSVVDTKNISPYLRNEPSIFVHPLTKPISDLDEMVFGNMPNEGGYLLLSRSEAEIAIEKHKVPQKFIRHFCGAQELIKGQYRYCIWVRDNEYQEAKANNWLNERFEAVRNKRAASPRATTQKLSSIPFRFGEVRQTGTERTIAIAAISSENRDYLPYSLLPYGTIISNKLFALYDAPLWNMAIIASRLHWVWNDAVSGRLGIGFSYSNTLCWNTFPLPQLTQKQRTDLTRCAENILLAREAHFPATLAELYDAKKGLPDNLHAAHEANDETLERVYIGRRFKNDTERLEDLSQRYTDLTRTPKRATS